MFLIYVISNSIEKINWLRKGINRLLSKGIWMSLMDFEKHTYKHKKWVYRLCFHPTILVYRGYYTCTIHEVYKPIFHWECTTLQLWHEMPAMNASKSPHLWNDHPIHNHKKQLALGL